MCIDLSNSFGTSLQCGRQIVLDHLPGERERARNEPGGLYLCALMKATFNSFPTVADTGRGGRPRGHFQQTRALVSVEAAWQYLEAGGTGPHPRQGRKPRQRRWQPDSQLAALLADSRVAYKLCE